MAGIKYQCEFYSNNNTRFRINIYHVSYSGSVCEFKAGMDGFKLKYEGTNDPHYKGIKASTFTFDFLITENPSATGTPTTGNIYGDLLQNNESKLFVIMQHYNVAEDTWINSWGGDIIDDTVTIADQPFPQRIRIRATDGMAKLKQKIYTPKTGASWLCVLQYFQSAIEQTLYYSTMFPSSGGTSTITIRNTSNRFHENMGNITDATWKDTYNPYKLALVNEAAFRKDNNEFMTYYAILDQLSTLFGFQFFQSFKTDELVGGTWWMFDRSVMFSESTGAITTSCRIFNNQAYDSSNTALTEYEYLVPNTSTLESPAMTITRSIGYDIAANRPKLKGNKISYAAPLGRVSTNYFHDLVSFPLNQATSTDATYSNLICWAAYGFAVSPNGYMNWIGSNSITVAPPDYQINTPYFPADMPYTALGSNNNGWFIPITAGQDNLVITGTLTFNYRFSWSYAPLDAIIAGENSFIDTSFKVYMGVRTVLTNKSASQYAQAQNDGNNLNDGETMRFLDGTFGSNGGPTATWSNVVTDFDDDTTPRVTFQLDNPPLVNDEIQSITIPFSIVSESYPNPFSPDQAYLKRLRLEFSNFSTSRMFSGSFLSLISAGQISIEDFSYTINDLKANMLFDGSQIADYFGVEKGRYSNYNTDASAQMDIKPDFTIGDPPPWISELAGGVNQANLAPTAYFGGIRITSPSDTNPTTTVPENQAQNNANWRTEHDSTYKPLHVLLCREIIKKRAYPVFKYDIKFMGLNQSWEVGFFNSFKVNMRLNETASDDIVGFFPIGGTYTAMTNTWHMHLQQMDDNTESNIQDDSYYEQNNDPFINNPNILFQADL